MNITGYNSIFGKVLFFNHELIFGIHETIKYERYHSSLKCMFSHQNSLSIFTQNTHASKHSYI